VTNNSSKTRLECLEKLHKLGFEAFEHEIYATSFLAGYYLRHVARYTGSKIYLIGSYGTQIELEKQGYICIGRGPDPPLDTLDDMVSDIKIDSEVGAVVVGIDYDISYMKLMRAATYLSDPKCLFIATNEDSRLPSHGPVVIPGTGCIVSAVQCAAERVPTIVGKPHLPMFDCISMNTGLVPGRTVMIGDRLNTDILFGKINGLKSLLVLTGITKQEDMQTTAEDNLPDYYADSIADVLSCLDKK
jgi:phosphoglycolate/pyridoxal phosphate phosphatase family enzyme